MNPSNRVCMNPRFAVLAVVMLVIAGSAAAGELRLVTANSGVADEFGYSVAADANLLLAGAPGENDQAGAAYVFRCENQGCLQEARLSNLTVTSGHAFGAEVALFGADLFVAAPRQNAGAVFAYQRPAAGVVTAHSVLMAKDGAAGDEFGATMAFDGNTLVIGAPGDDNDRGSVHVYVRQSGEWVLQSHLFAWDGAARDRFGSAVAIQGDRIAVGAPFDGGIGMASPYARGAVYLFTRSGGLWAPEQKILAPNAANGDLFGRSLHLSANRLVVGAPGRNDHLEASWFERPGGSWQNLGSLLPTAPWRSTVRLEPLFAQRRSMGGVPFAAVFPSPGCGLLTNLREELAGYIEVGSLKLRSPRPGDLSGWAGSASSSGVFVAAPGRNVTTQQQGAVAWYDPVRQMFDDSFDTADLCP
ncbi:MAG: FG-GAP repeat protein [Ahniella sp.]|nr:FG-GAP repeat protein [Ahniella sp.]